MSLPPQRVLVVDDERSIRLFLKAILDKEGYEVEVAASGEEALSRLLETRHDLLLVDLKMGAVGGIEVMAECKRRSPGTGVIVLTGHGSLDSAIQALRLGASDYLLKPCSDADLKTAVGRVLSQTREDARAKELLGRVMSWVGEDTAVSQTEHSVGEPAPVESPKPCFTPTGMLRVGELVIDRRRRAVTLSGRPITLTRTEYALLACLAENSDCPVSPRDIVRCVHGYDCLANEAGQLVKLHIKNLRQKIEVDPANPCYIRNVRAVGYLLSSNPTSPQLNSSYT